MKSNKELCLIAAAQWDYEARQPLPNIPELEPTAGMSDEQYRVAAKDLWEVEGEIEIDDSAEVSRGDSSGSYVAAWVWVNDDTLDSE